MSTSLVNNKYRITRRIGGGSFGEIYMGIGPNNEKVAVKFERHGTRCPQLRHEYKVYRELTNCHGFCSVYHFGTQDNYNVMVMDLLGPSLEDLFNKCNRRFSLKTVLQLADQLLERVDTLHSRHLIHRDIKPANFVVGLNDQGANIFCVDFGLSKRYRHPKNLQHIPHRDGRSLTGTPRYASINNHLGIEQSRRDDLESIGYVLIYFLKGSLPWQGLKAKNAQKKYRLILEKKQQVSIAQLCQGCPSQFAEFLAYTRSLKFDAKPDIPYLRKLFRDLYHAQGCGSVPKLWDWDGLDGETSGANSTITTPAINASGAGTPVAGLRPTTAAAVAGGGIESDQLLNGEEAYGDDEYRANAAGYVRPSTTQGGTWGYARQTGEQLPNTLQHNSSAQVSGSAALLKAGVTDYGTDPSRRPHTAHGARAGFPADGYAEEEDPHVVAGARGMMRYRRNRATSMEGNGQPVAGSAQAAGQQPNWSGSGGNAQWAYQNPGAGVKSSSQLASNANTQHLSLRKGQAQGAAAGWAGYSDRPKSAGITTISNAGSNGGSGTGLVASLTGQGRPSSSTPVMNTAGNWSSGGNPQGTSKQSAGGASGGSNSKSSKLFSLAR